MLIHVRSGNLVFLLLPALDLLPGGIPGSTSSEIDAQAKADEMDDNTEQEQSGSIAAGRAGQENGDPKGRNQKQGQAQQPKHEVFLHEYRQLLSACEKAGQGRRGNPLAVPVLLITG